MAEAVYQTRVLPIVSDPVPFVAPAEDHACRSYQTARDLELHFDTIKTLDEMLCLEQDWKALFATHGRSDHVFQSFELAHHWCQYFLPAHAKSSSTQLNIVTAYRGDTLVLVLPLVQVCAHGQCRLEWLGAPVSQYGDALVEEGPRSHAIVEAALDYVSQETASDIFVLRKVRADSIISTVLDARNPTKTSADIAPAISLPRNTSVEKFLSRYPAKACKNRRRHRRRLNEHGAVSLEVVNGGPQAVDYIRQAMTFKRAWLASRRLVSLAFSDERMDTFFHDLPEHLTNQTDPSCGLRVYALKCGERVVAINVALVCGDRLLTHIASYDLEFEKFSPGSLLFEDAIAHSLTNEVATFDLMSPGDAYKLDWTDHSVDVHDYALSLTTRGRAYEAVYIRRLRPTMVRIASELPRIVRPLARLINM